MSLPAPEPGELRALALEALGPHADPRARDALIDGELLPAPTERVWESSAGTVEGHAVTLRVDAATLGRLRAVPALADALNAALATAISIQSGRLAALSHLDLRWASDGAHAATQGYRDRPPDPPQTIGEALIAYLDAAGEPAAARIAEGAIVSERAASVHVTVSASARGDLRRAAAAAPRALTAALRDLRGDRGMRIVIDD